MTKLKTMPPLTTINTKGREFDIYAEMAELIDALTREQQYEIMASLGVRYSMHVINPYAQPRKSYRQPSVRTKPMAPPPPTINIRGCEFDKLVEMAELLDSLPCERRLQTLAMLGVRYNLDVTNPYDQSRRSYYRPSFPRKPRAW